MSGGQLFANLTGDFLVSKESISAPDNRQAPEMDHGSDNVDDKLVVVCLLHFMLVDGVHAHDTKEIVDKLGNSNEDSDRGEDQVWKKERTTFSADSVDHNDDERKLEGDSEQKVGDETSCVLVDPVLSGDMTTNSHQVVVTEEERENKADKHLCVSDVERSTGNVYHAAQTLVF